jgi:hypothetical protein
MGAGEGKWFLCRIRKGRGVCMVSGKGGGWRAEDSSRLRGSAVYSTWCVGAQILRRYNPPFVFIRNIVPEN